MRIAYLLLDPGIGVFGTKGASVHVQEVIRALRAEGHEVTVFATRTDSEIPADLADLEVHRFRLPSKADAAAREQATLATSREIAEQVRAGGFDAAYERYSLFSTAGAETGLPLILEVNAPLIDEQAGHRTLVDEAGALEATRASLAAARVITCVSQPVADWAIDHGADPARTVVTPNGVNTDRIIPGVPRAEGEEGPLTVGFVGTLKPWHGTEVLLRAVAHARTPLRLEIAGKGPELERLQQLAAELGIDARTVFHGAVAPEQMPKVLQRFDIATAPYPQAEDHYFSPLKVYEYLAAGLPTIASAIGAIPEILGEGRLGVLVDPGDEHALAEALDELAGDPGARTRMSAAARETAVAEHSWRSRVQELLARLAAATLREEAHR